MSVSFVCNVNEPVVQTRAGKLRGFQLDGIYSFHGIQYATAPRFLPPVPVEPWEGVRDALSYGYVSPLLNRPRVNLELCSPHRFWPEDENCQYLNVWTNSLDESAKKPVMFWIHGGGFATGASTGQMAYEGHNLAKYGDVVSVSVNHRLNMFGYLNLSDFGERFKNSGNAGMEDIVVALQWVRDNIARFGGDPENVTIFGQSGGGGKVTTLLQTPAADGLFHRAIVESGVLAGGPSTDKGSGKAIVSAMLGALGTDDVSALEKLPTDELIKLYNSVSYDLHAAGVNVDWAPFANDWYLGDPLEVGFTEHAKTVPTMVGTVIGEFSYGARGYGECTEEEKLALIKERYGQHAEELLGMFKKAYPGKNIADLLSLDTSFRRPSIQYLDLKAKSGAPSYSYMFAYDFPFNNGRPAWHASEIAFTFHNIEKVPVCNEPGVSDKLQDQIVAAWTAFARSGDPNCKELPAWPAYSEGCATMILDRDCETRFDYDREIVERLWQVAPPKRMMPFAPVKK